MEGCARCFLQGNTWSLQVWESGAVWGLSSLGSIILPVWSSTSLCVDLSWATWMKHGCHQETPCLVSSCSWASSLPQCQSSLGIFQVKFASAELFNGTKRLFPIISHRDSVIKSQLCWSVNEAVQNWPCWVGVSKVTECVQEESGLEETN